jgi:signal recognition particle subunit SRP54
MFNSLSDRLAATFKGLRGKGRLTEADIDETVREIRRALLEADVSLPVVRTFTARVKERSMGQEVSASLNPAQQVVKIVHEELIAILGGETRNLRLAKKPPTVIMLLGLQGAGKTTLAGKLARHLAVQGHQPVLVAADLQRPNAVNQLQIVAERAGVASYAPEPGNGVGDPVKVARDSIQHAQQALFDVVIIDTAGRLAIDAELMDQAAAIRDAVSPDELLLVIDSMIGQDAVATAASFQEGVGVDGVILTKLDGDARGGAALSVREATGAPIMFASVGEKVEDLEVFHPDRMASRILDMGDVLTLIEQAERAFDADQAARMADKVARGDAFTLEEFLEQMQAVKKMGSLGKLLGMLPGMADARKQLEQIDDRDLDRVAAIIHSMTPQERRDTKILNGSRRARIARGAGVQVSDVNNLVERFTEAQKMMKRMRNGGGMPGMPGMPPGMGGMPKKAKGKQSAKPKSKKGRSGNPAKRAQQASAVPEAIESAPAPFTADQLPEEFNRLLDGK